MDEIKDLLECIAKFDATETLEAKGRYFEVIQRDAQKLVKIFAIPVVSGNEVAACDNPHCDEGIVDRDYYGHPIFCHCCEQADR